MINQENTYLGADGLAYCKICGEPVEAFFPPDSILGSFPNRINSCSRKCLSFI